jgi:dTMP kinase
MEGGEGAGKTTQAALLAAALTAHGFAVTRTREPGGTPGAERLRALLLSGEVAFCPLAEAMLHAAARAEHVARVIRPALAAGAWVVCDRYTDSTMAYQGYGQAGGQQGDRAAIATLAGLVNLEPDLTLVLDVSEETAARRLAGRGGKADRYEAESAAFHARVRAGFRAIAAAAPARCMVINAEPDVVAVQAAIRAAVGARFGLVW